MPRKLIDDYTFYKIVNINGDVEMCYVGSTVNIKERTKNHRLVCNNENSAKYNRKLYKTIREHGGWSEFQMLPIGTVEQLTLTQARVIEEEYRIKLKADLNMVRCFMTPEERKEQSLEHMKKYRDTHKDKLAEYCSEKRKKKITCECGCIVQTYSLPAHKRTPKHIKIMEEMVTKKK